MAIMNRKRNALVFSIIFFWCFYNYLLLLRPDTQYFGQAISNQSNHGNQDKREKSNSYTCMTVRTTVKLDSTKSIAHTTTSGSRTTVKLDATKSNVHTTTSGSRTTVKLDATKSNVHTTTSGSRTTSKLLVTSIKHTVTHPTLKANKIKSIEQAALANTIKDLKSSKIILLWTKYYKLESWKLDQDLTRDLPMGRTYFRDYCPQYDCYLTINKQLYNYSHGVIFHEPNILYQEDKTMPLYRSSWQRWIYYNIESPVNADSYKKYPYHKNHAIYNWSMTYLNTSNVDARYGYIVPRIQPTRLWTYSWPIDYHGHKRHLIAWLVSNCMDERLRFVDALSKYIQVKIYGKCGMHSCQYRTNYDCWKHEIIQYKFYLAFENSICTDYVTEKFWYPLRFGIIPVVLGGSHYSKIAPPHSYIDATNFTSLISLAKYLHKVANNKELYNSYMKWRQHWDVMIPHHWCSLCSALYHYNSSSQHTYHTYNDDFGEQGVTKNCKDYPVPKG